MAALNIKFPDTDVVSVVFAYKTSNNRQSYYNEYDHVVDSDMRDLKEYYYRVPEHLMDKVHPGQAVVVHCATGYQVAEIKRINTYAPPGCKEPLAMVVDVVDINSFYATVERKKQVEVMRQQIEEEKKRLEAMVTYELIAEKNPEFKAMLDAFKEMGGSLT